MHNIAVRVYRLKQRLRGRKEIKLLHILVSFVAPAAKYHSMKPASLIDSGGG
jgi:hypothetical protein